MIERVAKAGAFARRSRHDRARDSDHYWEHLGAETQEVEMSAARASIGAMREPPSAVWIAMMNTVDDDGGDLHYRKWQAGIDAALAEPTS